MRGVNINWNQLYYFSQIALHGSVKKASQFLGLSTSTLSEHLTQLERDLNIPLFTREHRKLILTQEGSRLFQHVKQMFEIGLRMVDVVSPLSLGSYPLSVGVAPGGNVVLASRILSEYIRTYGNISAQINQSDVDQIERGLIGAQFDFAISHRPAESAKLVSSEFSSHAVGLFCTKEIARKGLKKLLFDIPLLLPVADGPQRQLANRVTRALDIPMSSTIQSDYISVLLAICSAGQGVGVFNTDWVKRHAPTLVQLSHEEIAAAVFDRTYVLWARGAENSEVIRRLQTVMKALRSHRPDVLGRLLTQDLEAPRKKRKPSRQTAAI